MTKVFSIFILMSLFGTGCTNGNSENMQQQPEKSNTEVQEEKVQQEEIEPKPLVYITMETTMGDIHLELDPNRAPITVENFMNYVNNGTYENTIFHRVIPNFMIQGGGFTPEGDKKPTDSPILLESNNGLPNNTGTIAMARTNAPNSATNQFFINVADNRSLNYTPNNPGYAVFGKVTAGMDVVNAIRSVETTTNGPHANWPVEPIIIKKVSINDRP